MRKFLYLVVFFIPLHLISQNFNSYYITKQSEYYITASDNYTLLNFEVEIIVDTLPENKMIIFNDSIKIEIQGYISNIHFDSTTCNIETVIPPCCCSDEKIITVYSFFKNKTSKITEYRINQDLLIPIEDVMYKPKIITVNDTVLLFRQPTTSDFEIIDACTGELRNGNYLCSMFVKSALSIYEYYNKWELLLIHKESSDAKDTFFLGWRYK